MPFVEPPTASSTRSAFSTLRSFTMRSGVTPSRASSTARAPVASATRKRSACTAGGVAAPGRLMPSASVTHAIVLAVPITAHVPAVVARFDSSSRMRASSSSPARYRAHHARQSVHAPRRLPSKLPVIIAPTTSAIAGLFAEIAPMSCAGTVLSQPPISTTESIGCARIISSTSIAMRFRKTRLVGVRYGSPSEIVGNSSGNPPAARTPRETAATRSGVVRWQLLNPPPAVAIPTIGRSSIASE